MDYDIHNFMQQASTTSVCGGRAATFSTSCSRIGPKQDADSSLDNFIIFVVIFITLDMKRRAYKMALTVAYVQYLVQTLRVRFRLTKLTVLIINIYN